MFFRKEIFLIFQDLAHFTSQKKLKKLYSEKISYVSRKIFLIFRGGCWPSIKFLIPCYTTGWLLLNRRITKFNITQDDCWFSLLSKLSKLNHNINRFSIIFWKNDFLSNEKVSYTCSCISPKNNSDICLKKINEYDF